MKSFKKSFHKQSPLLIRPLSYYFFQRRKNTDKQDWKEKGAPFRSGGAKRRIQGIKKKEKNYGAKRRIQGCYTNGLKRNGGVFSFKNFMC